MGNGRWIEDVDGGFAVVTIGLEPNLAQQVHALAGRAGARAFVVDGFEIEEAERRFDAGCVIVRATRTASDWVWLDRPASRGAHFPTIFFTAFPDVDYTVQLFKAGAFDVLTFPLAPRRLLAVLDAVQSEQRAARAAEGEVMDSRRRLAGLTARQHQVLRLLIEGCSNGEAARRLRISERTVKAHRKCIMARMGFRSLVELARRWEQIHARTRDIPACLNASITKPGPRIPVVEPAVLPECGLAGTRMIAGGALQPG